MAYWKKLLLGLGMVAASPILVPLGALAWALFYLLFAACFVVGVAKFEWTR